MLTEVNCCLVMFAWSWAWEILCGSFGWLGCRKVRYRNLYSEVAYSPNNFLIFKCTRFFSGLLVCFGRTASARRLSAHPENCTPRSLSQLSSSWTNSTAHNSFFYQDRVRLSENPSFWGDNDVLTRSSFVIRAKYREVVNAGFIPIPALWIQSAVPPFHGQLEPWLWFMMRPHCSSYIGN